MTSLPYRPKHWDWVHKQFPDGIEVAVEVGSYAGEWAFGLLENCNVNQLFCVDPWGNDRIWKLWKRKLEPHKHRVCPIVGASTDVAKRFFHTIDLLYIDANHRRVLEDITAWWPHVRKGGIALFHDWQLHSVHRDIVAFFKDAKKVTPEAFGPRTEKSAWFRRED